VECLPQELQLMVLKCHEELIAEKVGRERDHELLSSELRQLRRQSTTEETVTNEISHLRDQLGE